MTPKERAELVRRLQDMLCNASEEWERECLKGAADALESDGRELARLTALERFGAGEAGGVILPKAIYQGALDYIRHVGANFTERGQPHPQQWIVDGLLAAAPKVKP